MEQDNLILILTENLPAALCSLPNSLRPFRTEGGSNGAPVQFRYGEQRLAAQVIGHMGKISTPEEFTDLSGRNNKVYHDDLVGKLGLEMYEDVLETCPKGSPGVHRCCGQAAGGTGVFVEANRGLRQVIWSLPSTPGSEDCRMWIIV